MHIPLVERNFKEEAAKQLVIGDCVTRRGYVDLSGETVNTVTRRTWKCMMNLYVVYKSCGANMTHLKCREQLVWYTP
jgi:hypothetical protein